ncbi:ABC transporter ATP-binding protein [Brachybacterium sp. JHP9]|uniref:ABC transporter ATP-binding protein n=1 Tax=Brachybacterium equifaecis TaxID=2910770 RepID=A0ABT0R1A7_9MICO|nr:ABC transporter ATP-binding protein [Brachybacterium equifaecis]MCL6423188.1 ABC transporter ATP-binding protein [Brachybacterium equifaecis]
MSAADPLPPPRTTPDGTAPDGTVAAAVEARDVSKVFFAGGGEPVWALEDFSLSLEEGSFTCIVGPSGCGKSTFLRILGGLEERTSGEIRTSAQSHAIPSAFVFQEHGVFPWMTVRDNVAFGLRMSGVGAAERSRIADDWLERVRLGSFGASYPHQLSGGMRQRVAIARAFATGSPVLLMDEPLGALDAQTRMLMQEELIALWEAERKTVLMVTHDIDEAILLGDSVIVMSGRPGTLREDITVPFPRPRSFDVERSAEFSALRGRIWDLLREDQPAARSAA